MAIIESGINLEDRIKDLEVRNAVANLRNAATSSLAKYDLADQVIDDFQTAAGLHTAFSGYAASHTTGYIKGESTVDSDTVLLISGEGDSTVSSNDTAVTASNLGELGSYSGGFTVNSAPLFKTGTGGFGTYSMFFDGTDDYMRSAANPAGFNIGAPSASNGDWTLECRLKMANNNNSGRSLLGYQGTTGSWANIGYNLYFVDTTTNKIVFATGGGPSQEAIPSGGKPDTEYDTSAWHHICLINSNESGSYDGSKMCRLFLDGAHVANGTASTGTLNSGSAFKFNIAGYTYPGVNGGDYPTLYLQDIRFSTTARYDRAGSGADFTAPTTSLLSGGGGGMTAGNMVAVSLDTATAAASPVPIRGDLVIMYEDTSGTATVNTDIIGYVSRDSGSTWATATLVSEGALGTSKIVAHHDIDVSGHGSARTMRYKITTANQDVKETRITGVALGWH